MLHKLVFTEVATASARLLAEASSQTYQKRIFVRPERTKPE